MSRYDLFRRRIAPIAFFVAIALIVRDSCEKNTRAHTLIEIELGDARPQVREIYVEIFAGAPAPARDIPPPPIATQRCVALPDAVIGPCRFQVASPDEDGTLEIDVTLGTEHRHLSRRFHVIEGSTMLVSIANDLRRPRDVH